MPIGHIFVRDAGSDVKHDDTALTLNVITITKTTKLFLSSSIPNIEADGAEVCGELKRVNFNTKGG